MYKVLLVDDEKPVLDNMRKVIKWEECGFSVCGTADCGEQACELLEKMEVNLVITDVMMPQMNGIQLAEYIGSHFPKTEMIIISGYDEFDYAQSAMRAGVMEYITKPTNPTELETALKNAARRIQRRENTDQNIIQLKKEVEKRKPLLRNQYLVDLSNQMKPETFAFRPLLTEEEIENSKSFLHYENESLDMLHRYGSALTGKTWQLWCFDLDEDAGYGELPEWGELMWAQLGILIREILEETFIYDSFTRGRFLYYIVENGDKRLTRDYVETLMEKVLGEFHNLTRVNLSVGISREYEKYQDLYLARQDCESALEERCNMGGGNCIFYEEVCIFPEERLSCNQELLQRICMKIRALNKVEAGELIEVLYRDMQQNKAVYSQFYSQTVLILTELYQVASGDDVRERIRKEMAVLFDYKTSDALKTIVLNIMNDIIEDAAAESELRNQELMEKIVQYVEAHMGQEISLADVADAVHLSKNYLCSLFKKEKGETFFTYLTGVRMEKAKQLLRKTDHKGYVIAEKVGYTDYAYFSQVFKKYTGVTTKEYRKIYSGI